MAKLDDFGRPIYETAEEYNQARRAREQNRTYESLDGDTYQQSSRKETHRFKTAAQRHATVQGSKSVMKKVLAILGVILSINVGAIFSLLGNITDDIQVGHVEEEVQVYDEYLNQGDTPLTEGYEQFFYNGEYYSIPTNYWKISQMGFETDVYDADELIPAGYEEIIALFDEYGYMSIEVRIKNNTEEDIPLNECMVDYIYITNPIYSEEIEVLPDFSFGDGLTFESSYEEVEAYMGEAYWHYGETSEECDYHMYQWVYWPEEANELEEQEDVEFVEIVFFDGVIESIRIEKRAYEDKY